MARDERLRNSVTVPNGSFMFRNFHAKQKGINFGSLFAQIQFPADRRHICYIPRRWLFAVGVVAFKNHDNNKKAASAMFQPGLTGKNRAKIVFFRCKEISPKRKVHKLRRPLWKVSRGQTNVELALYPRRMYVYCRRLIRGVLYFRVTCISSFRLCTTPPAARRRWWACRS